MNMLPHLFQAIAKRSAGAGLNELNFGRMIVDEGGPLHALVFATGKFVIFHDALFERRGIENAENFCPIFNSLVEVFNEHTDVRKRTTWHIHISRSEEHTSELQSLMRISYAVFCLKKKKQIRS